jgi:molybdopterin-guanine dinucleotide biosynthesis protein A
MTREIVVGIFVGGESRRMGGRAKGLLVAPDGEPILARTIALARELSSDVVLVGKQAEYAHVEARAIDDAEPRSGPLGALVALLAHAGERRAIALACDMPRITRALLARLAIEDAEASILAPRTEGRWSPLFARYDPSRVLAEARARLGARELSLQPLLDAIGARELDLDAEERRAILDWDAPEDIDRS